MRRDGTEELLRRSEISISGMAATLISAGVAAAGTAVSAIGAAKQAQGEQNILDYNAQVQRQEAVTAQQTAQEQAAQEAVQTHRTIGQEIANAGASGVDPSQGSPPAVMSDAATEGELIGSSPCGTARRSRRRS